MDILMVTVRKEGVLALYKGTNISRLPSTILPFNNPHPATRDLTGRDDQSPPGDRRRDLAGLWRVRHLEAHHLAVWTALAEGDRCGGRHGGRCELGACEPGGDVQGADAGPVWESGG